MQHQVLAGRYRLLRKVAEGGMGVVYHGEDLHDNRPLAIKKIVDLMPDDEDRYFYDKFLTEVGFLKQLRHPQIPRVWDSLVEDGCGFIIMELIEGSSLLQVTENQKSQTGSAVPPGKVIEYAIQVCSILAYLHKRPGQPIVHRDVNPNNIILRNGQDEVVLVDFGLARTITDTQSTLTSCGTSGYAPVEQLSGEAEPRSDLYGLGATMYFMLSGQHPVPLTVCSPPAKPSLAAVIEKATQQKPARRYPSAVAMQRALLALWDAEC